MRERVVGLFAKPVVAGEVKTRLCPPLTPEQAANLYGAFLADLAGMLDTFPDAEWEVFSTAPQAQRNSWPERSPEPVAWHRQEGDDLGTRMHHALTRLLEPGERRAAVLIGSDLPTLVPDHLRSAFAKLERHDVVFGPSLDGGYYLVGMREPHPEVFRDIVWSSPEVLAETVRRLRESGLSAGFLPPWYDVDEAADLAFLRAHLAALALEHGPDAPCPRTRAALGLESTAGENSA